MLPVPCLLCPSLAPAARPVCPRQCRLQGLNPDLPPSVPAGHSLLKKKADALSMRFRLILKRLVDTKEEMGRVMKVGVAVLCGDKLGGLPL